MQSFNEHLIKEAIKFHIETNRPFCDNTFRPYTDEFYELYREARRMWKSGEIEVKESFEKEMLSSDIGEFVEVNGELLPLDLPLMEDDDVVVHEDDSSSIGTNILLENAADTGDDAYLIQETYIVGDADTDKTAQNELFDTLDDTVLDFSESNPFGDAGST